MKLLLLFLALGSLPIFANPGVAGGNHHTFILTTDGDVLSMGQDLHMGKDGGTSYVGGKLARPIDQAVLPGKDPASLLARANYNPSRKKVIGLDGLDIASVHTGQNDGAVVTKDGALYMWGPNNRGQLGLGDTDQRDRPTLVPIPDGVRISTVSIGSAHTLALTTTGDVYSWGEGSSGVLGHGSTDDVLSPRQIEALAGMEIAAIAAAQNTHSVFLTTAGDIYTCGVNRHGQLGHGNKEKLTSPKKVASDTGFKAIGVGVQTTFAVDQTGLLWGWGNGSKAHFARTDGSGAPDLQNFLSPQRIIAAPADLSAVAAGSRHVVVLTESGEIFIWGIHSTISGQLGIGPPLAGNMEIEKRMVLTPQRIDLPDQQKCLSIDAMANNTFVTTANKIYGWGQTAHGRLGMPINAANQYTTPEGRVLNIAYEPVEILQTETSE